GHTRMEIFPHALPHLLAMKDRSQQRENRLHQQPSIPGPTLAYFHVHWIPGLRMKPRVRQENHGVKKLGDRGVKMCVMDVRRRAVPRTDHTPLIQHKTQLAAPDPPIMTLPFLPDLLRTAPFPHRMDELYPIAVGDAQHRWCSQKLGRPRGVGLEQGEQARPLWYRRKPGLIIAPQPAVKRTSTDTFDGKQECQRRHLTGVQF